jgi:ABC-type nitrate/sulfonate/bicarbonate transport system permease component
MSEFGKAFEFIAHNGAVAGAPQLPSLTSLALETLWVGAIGVAIALVISIPAGVWLGPIHWRSTSATWAARCRAS